MSAHCGRLCSGFGGRAGKGRGIVGGGSKYGKVRGVGWMYGLNGKHIRVRLLDGGNERTGLRGKFGFAKAAC